MFRWDVIIIFKKKIIRLAPPVYNPASDVTDARPNLVYLNFKVSSHCVSFFIGVPKRGVQFFFKCNFLTEGGLRTNCCIKQKSSGC